MEGNKLGFVDSLQLFVLEVWKPNKQKNTKAYPQNPPSLTPNAFKIWAAAKMLLHVSETI